MVKAFNTTFAGRNADGANTLLTSTKPSSLGATVGLIVAPPRQPPPRARDAQNENGRPGRTAAPDAYMEYRR